MHQVELQGKHLHARLSCKLRICTKLCAAFEGQPEDRALHNLPAWWLIDVPMGSPGSPAVPSSVLGVAGDMGSHQPNGMLSAGVTSTQTAARHYREPLQALSWPNSHSLF